MLDDEFGGGMSVGKEEESGVPEPHSLRQTAAPILASLTQLERKPFLGRRFKAQDDSNSVTLWSS